jgi:RNA polymerase sigma-70 factor (ECF subfamily)
MTDLIERARAGDEQAFSQLVDPHRRELEVHCYRMLGSLQDAEDALQETLISAWQGFDTFEGRASVRTWLYRIATNRCLNALRAESRRPLAEQSPFTMELPDPTRLGEVLWLEPYPDSDLIEGSSAGSPEVMIEEREAISLAFITALQVLPPLQRTVLILRDVLGFRAAEVAGMLETTEESVTSALKRARATVEQRRSAEGLHEPPPSPGSPAERAVIEQLTRAYESGDVKAVVSLMTDDVWLTMPPGPLEYQGLELAEQFLSAVAFTPGRQFRLIETRANGAPAFGFYVVDPVTGVAHGIGLLVVTLAGTKVSSVARFENSLFDRFGLSRTV